jgi:hypothetical protein
MKLGSNTYFYGIWDTRRIQQNNMIEEMINEKEV